ncbi:hypothetical protein TH63_15495 [Rufibacter radiotolerans]|uniref:Uncharacterized protein n=1 Tax=Rufibacter radiotolerans TaxID=1379910 RepID=A0A0H4W8D2_9BACT|nr:hypothetical protein TH63_15495 [Rufibacter radiotolerans]
MQALLLLHRRGRHLFRETGQLEIEERGKSAPGPWRTQAADYQKQQQRNIGPGQVSQVELNQKCQGVQKRPLQARSGN